jgi:hypothetical protein
MESERVRLGTVFVLRKFTLLWCGFAAADFLEASIERAVVREIPMNLTQYHIPAFAVANSAVVAPVQLHHSLNTLAKVLNARLLCSCRGCKKRHRRLLGRRDAVGGLKALFP